MMHKRFLYKNDIKSLYSSPYLWGGIDLIFGQCDQTARLFFQYLVIYNNVNLPKSIKKLPDQAEDFAKYYLNHPKMANYN